MKIFQKTGRDLLHNGTVLGGICGALVIWGTKVYDWIIPIIPEGAKTFAGEWSLPIVFITLGMLIGYIIDRY